MSAESLRGGAERHKETKDHTEVVNSKSDRLPRVQEQSYQMSCAGTIFAHAKLRYECVTEECQLAGRRIILTFFLALCIGLNSVGSFYA
jgi:hypothetical protein